MSSHPAPIFELRGQFGGFVRTLLGRRRMLLRLEKEKHFLKVEKELRHRLKSALAPGAEVLVIGHERPSDRKRVVDEVKLMTADGPVACAVCPIRVCTKKNCWRNGGKELWQTLEETLAREGLTETIPLEGAHCLDHCKRGPNAEWKGHDFHHCTPADAGRIVGKAESGKEK